MGNVKKMPKQAEKEVLKLDDQEFTTLKEIFNALNQLSASIANLEIDKQVAVQNYLTVEKEFKDIKGKLTYKHGPINLNMTDGTFTLVEKEVKDEPSNTEN